MGVFGLLRNARLVGEMVVVIRGQGVMGRLIPRPEGEHFLTQDPVDTFIELLP